MPKHRKLFLEPENQNATAHCPDICVPTCPSGCGYSELPPSPPQPATTQNSVWSSTSSKHDEHISPLAIGIVIFLAACFIVITLYLLTARFRRRRWDFLRRGRGPTTTTTEDFLDENHAPAGGIDYPIWYINTVGLRPAVIDSITVFRYRKDDRLIEGTECAVCLAEFCEDDSLRLLPKCSHAFHIPCIDTWLRSHVNCPVCRAGIITGVSASIPVALNVPNEAPPVGHETTNQIGEDLEITENRGETGEVDQTVEVQERKMEDGNSTVEQSEPVRTPISMATSLPLHLSTENDDDS